ncbi:MAG: hypothetical protein JNK38_08965 [Acidobacteria bacterium]|nr:hypothetical protein [Acidobacteriota bacterium]
MVGYKVEVTEKAQEETREAVRWIAQRSPEKAALWHFELTRKLTAWKTLRLVVPLRQKAKLTGKKSVI